MPSSEFLGERFLVDSASDSDRLESHPFGILNTEMTESPDAVDRDKVSGSCSTVSESVVSGNPSTHERRRLDRLKPYRDQSETLRMSDHVVGIPSIVGDSGDRHTGFAIEEISPSTRTAVTAVTPMPTHPDSLANPPPLDSRPEGVDDSNHLMTGYARIFDTGELALDSERITVADPARLDFDPYCPLGGFGNFDFDQLQRPLRFDDLDSTHCGHGR
jgi:hypothetical protein